MSCAEDVTGALASYRAADDRFFNLFYVVKRSRRGEFSGGIDEFMRADVVVEEVL